MRQTNARARTFNFAKLKRLPRAGHVKYENSSPVRDSKLSAIRRRRKSTRVTHLRRPRYGLIIISDNPFHYADDQRGHVTRLPTGMPVDGSNGKREVADKKKKKKKNATREKEKGREKCTLDNNNNRGRRHGQKYGAAGAAHRGNSARASLPHV